MSENVIKISFPGKDLAEAGDLARQLASEIKTTGEDVTTQIERDNSENLDFGATLVVVLGSAATVQIAKGLAKCVVDFLDCNRIGEVTCEVDGKKFQLKNANVSALTELLSAVKR